MKPLKLEILFGYRDRLSPALKMMIGSSNAAAKALRNTNNEIKKLNDQQKQIDGYKRQKKATEESAKALKDMQDRIKSLRQQMASNPTAELTRDFEKAKAAAKRLKDAHQLNQQQLQQLRNELNQSGISTNNLSQHQLELRRRTDQANAELERQRNALRNLDAQQRTYQQRSQNVRNAGMTGFMMAGAGVAAMYQMRKPIDESKQMDISENRIAAIGLGKDATKEAILFARAMKTFGTSTRDNMNLVLDGATAFADVHHAKMVAPMLAKMKFANEAMFGNEQGAENEKKFMDMLKVIEMRNGLKSEKAFKDQANIIQQVITATGGRVQPEEWLNATKRGGIAVQGLTNEAFYYKMEPIVQMMGGHGYGNAAMSAYQNLYQGRTTQRAANNLAKFDLIGDPSKVKYNKTGDLAHLDIGAIKGAALFKKDQFAWMEQVLIPAINAKGITKEDDVIDVIGSFFSNRTASNLFAKMYAQRENIHKNSKLNAGADNIDQLSGRAKNTTAGKELEARAKLHDAYLQFGTTILPIYTQAMIMAANAMQGFTTWMQKNPALASMLGKGLLVIAAGLIAIGGLLVVFSPLILGMLSLRLMMVTLGVQGSTLSFVLKMLTSPFKMIGNAALWLGRIILLVGRFMLANPIILAITLLATAAYLIYKNWEPIKEFFSGIWGNIKTGASDAWSWVSNKAGSAWESTKTTFSPVGSWFSDRWNDIKNASSGGIKGVSALILNWSPIGLFYAAFAKVLSWFGIDLPAKFSTFGKNIIDGLVNGITAGFEKLKSLWQKVMNYMPDFTQKRNEIRSPSRLFKRFGGYITEGLHIGLMSEFPQLKNQYNKIQDLFTAGINSPAMDKVKTAAPLVAKILPGQAVAGTARSGGMIIEGDTITVHIHAAPGQPVNNLLKQFEQFLNQRDREKAARIRDSYLDQE